MIRRFRNDIGGNSVATVLRRGVGRILRAGPGVWLRNREPVFFLGNQKSGTTAITALTAAFAARPVALDLRCEQMHPILDKVVRDEIKIAQFIAQNWRDFRQPIIKDPNLTLLWPKLRSFYPSVRYVYIVRDPRDNIRSILNRLGIQGNLSELPSASIANLPVGWIAGIDGRNVPKKSSHYVETLALRWNWMNDLYRQYQSSTVLVKYEDFVNDKSNEIARLADALGLEERADISHLVDRQYQRPGDRNVDVREFLGSNLERIEVTCREHLLAFGYPVPQSISQRH